MGNATDHLPILATGASQRFGRTLWQCLESLAASGSLELVDVHVWDLGLDPAFAARLEAQFPFARFHRFDFSQWPAHFAVARNSWGWKPAIINMALEQFRRPVLWCDSGTLIRAGLAEPLRILSENGTVGLWGQAQLGQRCHPAVLDGMGVAPEIRSERERIAGFVGFDPAHPQALAIARQWLEACRREDWLLAAGFAHHKQDQALLNAILLPAAAAGRIRLNEGDADISSARPVRWISTRNRLAPDYPLTGLASRKARLKSRLTKWLDRLWHRWRRFETTRLHGLERVWREHFTVWLARDGESPRALRAPRLAYWADPFLIEQQGELHCLVEEYRYPKARGHLTCLTLDAALRVTRRQRLQLPLSCHLSYPHVFRHQGRLLLIPESHQNRAIDLFEAVDFPGQWRLKRRLLYGLDAADSTLLEHAGRVWLFTSVAGEDGGHRHLEIWHSDDLFSGSFTPHPINAERRFRQDAHGTGRCAGPFIRQDGLLLRPMQHSRTHYGEGHQLMEIVELTAESFVERPFSEIRPGHHVCRLGPVTASDRRDRAR